MFQFDEIIPPVLGLGGLEANLTPEELEIQRNAHLFAEHVMRPIGTQLDKLTPEEVIAEMIAEDHDIHLLVLGADVDIRTAMDLIDREGGTSQLVRVFMRHTNQLGDLPSAAAVALEVAANEAREQRLLRLEAAALEQYWREAEALASIVDGELTPISGMERLRLRAAESY